MLRWAPFLVALALGGCASTQPVPHAPVAPVVDYGVRVFAGDTEVNTAAMLDALAKADYVLVGETHLDDQTHRLEHTILEGLIARRGAAGTVLSMEMFTRDQQGALDAYAAGSIDEAAFLEQAPPWPNYRTGYRPLVEAAKQHGVPVVGANLPRSLQRAFAMKKAAARDALTEEQKAWFPAEVFPPAESYWARIEKRLRDAGHGHMGAMDAQARTWAIQNLWDNTMADAMVQARASNPDAAVVHMVGAFHAEHGDGIANQLRQRDPDASIAIVTIEPVFDLRGLDGGDPQRADYVVYALADARGLDGGTHGVTVHGELKYRLAAPPVGEPSGLLVWLGDDETAPRDALTHWRHALGDEVMVAVVEPPHRVQTADGRVAGRWTWPDTFSRDASGVVAAIDRMTAYLGHRWQIPEDRIVVAGRGGGADVALWSGLYGDAPHTVVALQPSSAHRLAEAGIPDEAPEDRHVLIAGDPEALAPALHTLELAKVPAEARAQVDAEAELRSALGLPARAMQGKTEVMRIQVGTPIALQWARLHARLAESADGRPRNIEVAPDQPPTLTASPDSFREGQGLPLAPGAFGGTTLLVLPPDLEPAVRDAWKALGEQDVLKKRSRFATLIVVDDAELGTTLDTLRERGKRSMLVVPAAFVVSPARMQAIQALVQGHDHELDMHYLPGLGGTWGASLASD